MDNVKQTISSRRIPVKNTIYRIISRQSKKAIEVSDNEAVYLNEPSESVNQQFSFLPSEDGYYQIISKSSGKALDIALGGTQNGAQIHQWTVHGGDNQLWAVQTVARGIYILRAKASGRCMDIAGISSENGARLQIWDDVGGENQQWMLKAVKQTATRKPSASKSTVKKSSSTVRKSPSTKKKS